MSYDYKVAKDALSDTDKNRLVCLYLSATTSAINGVIDWEKAANMFGCASVDSMKVMTRSALKKIEAAGGKEGVEGNPEKAGKAAAGGRKRKGKADAEADDVEAKPAPKKPRGKKAKKEATPVAEDDDDAEGAVKAEDGDDFN